MGKNLKAALAMMVVAIFVSFAGPTPAAADLLFGLDLPTMNLNGYPLSSYPDRSNLSPSYPTYSTKPATYLVEGGSFLIGSPGEKYVIEKASFYMVYGLASGQYDTTPIDLNIFPQISLWAGVQNNIQHISASDVALYMPYTITRVWYPEGSNYQRGSDGAWRGFFRLDFTPAMMVTINGGEKYYCFLDGLFQNYFGNWQSPSVLGANPDKGGLTPVGTLQDPMLFFDTGTHMVSNATFVSRLQFYANGAIYGHLTPLPGSLLLLGTGLLGLLACRKFRKS